MRGPTHLAMIAAAALAGCASAELTGDGGAEPDAAAGGPDAADVDAPAIDAPPPDAVPVDATPLDATLEARSVTHDSAADFTGATGAADLATVEPWGAVAPIAYYTGGLVHRGSDTGYFTDGAAATWADVQGFTPTAKTAIAWNLRATWGADTPPSVGLTDGDFWSQWYEGEIYLEQGSWTFYLLADDHGFVEVAPPGSPTFTRVASANWPNEGSGAFNVTTTGWHPIRIAVAEQTVDALIDLRFAGPGVAQGPIPRDRLRARADHLVGLVQAGFDDFRGVGDVETTIDAVTPGNTTWNTGNPGDLGMTSADEFSVRWTGQIRIDVAGDYTLRYVTDDGQRLWVGGMKILDAWDDQTHDQVTGPMSLAAGWHDVVIEQTEFGGAATANLTVQTGPDLIGQAFPLDRLRPVEGRGERIAPGVSHADVAIPDLATVQSTVTVTAPAGAVVLGVDVSYQFTHTYKGDMTFSLRAPDGTTVQLVDYTGSGSGTWTERFHLTTLDGRPVGGTWTLVATDELSGDTGTVLDFAVTPHYVGGTPPIPTSATFDSTVLDLGDGVTSIDLVDWAERVPPGADVAVRVRTCAQAGDCATAAWSDPVTAPGGAPTVAPARHLQYRIELTSDGDRAPALEWIRIDYQVAL